MIHFSHAEMDHRTAKDLPPHDEPTRALGIPNEPTQCNV